MGPRPTGRSLATSWGDRRQDDETDRSHRDTHRRIDGLKIPAQLVVIAIEDKLAVGTDQAQRLMPPQTLYLERVAIMSNIAPDTGDVVVDVTVGGDSIFDPNSLPRIRQGIRFGFSESVVLEKIRDTEYPIVKINVWGYAAPTSGQILTVALQGYYLPDTTTDTGEHLESIRGT